MTETLETLVPIFWKRGLEKVFADVEVGNVASGMVLRRCGFRVVEGGGGVVEMGERAGGGSWECERMEMANPNGEGWKGEGKVEGEGEGEGDGDDNRGNRDRGRG